MRLGIFIERKDSSERRTSCDTGTVSIEATPKDEILLEEMRRRYDLQQSEIDTADTKAGLILAYLSAVLVIIVTSGPDIFGKIMQTQSVLVIVMASVTLLLYVGGVFCCVKAIAPWTFLFPVGIEEQEIEFYVSQERSDTVLQLLKQYSEYIQLNLPRIISKSRWFLGSLVFSLAFTFAGTCTVCLAQL